MTTRSGQFIGGAVSLGLVALWLVFAFFNPYGKQGQTPQTWVTVVVMLALAIAGLAFALTRHAAGVLIVAGASLLPVGLYMLGTPGLFRWIGILDVLLLAAGLLLLPGRGRGRSSAPGQ